MKHCLTDGGRSQFMPHEKRDCTVRALSAAAGLPYIEAHGIMRSYGRKDRYGVYMSEVLGAMKAAPINGFIITPIGDTGITLKRYIESYCQAGRFLLLIRGHALAVLDGVIHDLGKPKPRARVLNAYRFDPA